MSSAVAKAQVARLHYEGRLSKQDIAARLGISRFKVARLLDQARDEGIVRFEIHDPLDVDGRLGRALESAFGLRLAIVVREAADIPRAAAAWLPELLTGEDVLGVAWGATLRATAEALGDAAGAEPEVRVVQICGAIPELESGTGPAEVAIRFAERLGGPVHPLPVPALAGPLAAELVRNPAVRPTVALFDAVTLALVGVGADPGRLPGVPAGAVGHVLVHAFDTDGRPAGTSGDGAIALGREQLAATRTVAVAGGAGKAAAVRGALRSGLLWGLVTDAATARAVTA